ncbi:hypothetical protein TanjilG_31173 [Lupinus angustifolius]|uniref:RING-type E3 ubiquitin transferase n=1 Tax=Lupinus angustifolius TaxID=3871 RepID=A0A394DDX4_LUPAN|nr:hypothetical protein TanjilG_31173 [Lupinus angustifolius]
MRIRQSNNPNQNEVNFDPSIGSSHRDNPPSPTIGNDESFLDEQSELNNNLSNQDNSNIVNHPNVGEAIFPSPMQISQEMDYSIMVDSTSLPTSGIHAEVNNSQPQFLASSSLIPDGRGEVEFRHALLEHLRAGGSLQVEGVEEEEEQNEEEINVEMSEEAEEDDAGMWLTREEIRTSIRHETIEFAAEDNQEKEVCDICQDGYVNGDKVGRLDCSHKFHIGCISDWLVRKNICPKCRRMALLPIYVDYTT